MIEVAILKDSINSATDDRLTTFEVTFPRFINAEILRHRMLSFNSASSRAIPSEKLVASVERDPAEPVFWGANQKGMQASSELKNDTVEEGWFWFGELGEVPLESGANYSADHQMWSRGRLDSAKKLWFSAGKSMVAVARRLNDLGLHKQIANRILEPWQNITMIISGTEWENFFRLRASAMAQPEFRALAEEMLEAYNRSLPEVCSPVTPSFSSSPAAFTEDTAVRDSWHVPFEDRMPPGIENYDKLKIAVARCARVSYLAQDGTIDVAKDFELFDRLTTSGHWSPCEHVAFAMPHSRFHGNFKGWMQLRKLFQGENQRDHRVVKRRVVDGIVLPGPTPEERNTPPKGAAPVSSTP